MFRSLHYPTSRFPAPQCHSNRHHLRSADSPTLVVRPTRRSTLGDRAFPVAAARAWNSLPSAVRDAPLLSSFRSRLKTWLFDTVTQTLPGCTSFSFVVFVICVKCRFNVIHDSVTINSTSLVINNKDNGNNGDFCSWPKRQQRKTVVLC